jgi:hypothetical protein
MARSWGIVKFTCEMKARVSTSTLFYNSCDEYYLSTRTRMHQPLKFSTTLSPSSRLRPADAFRSSASKCTRKWNIANPGPLNAQGTRHSGHQKSATADNMIPSVLSLRGAGAAEGKRGAHHGDEASRFTG